MALHIEEFVINRTSFYSVKLRFFQSEYHQSLLHIPKFNAFVALMIDMPNDKKRIEIK